MAEAWERQKGESSKYFAWFKIYRDIYGERSYQAVIDEIEENTEKYTDVPLPKLDQLKKAGSKWKWADRSRKYDNYLDAQQRELREKEYLQVEDRLLEVGNRLVDSIDKNIDDLEYNIDDSKSTSVSHAISSVAKAYDSTVKNLRLLYGRSTEIKDETTEGKMVLDADVVANASVKSMQHIELLSDDFLKSELDAMRTLIEARKP